MIGAGKMRPGGDVGGVGGGGGGGGLSVMSVTAGTDKEGCSVEVTVAEGTDALIFYSARATRYHHAVQPPSVSDGTQFATVVSGTSEGADGSYDIPTSVWELRNPAVGTSTWTVASRPQCQYTGLVCIAVTGLDTSDPFAHSAVVLNNTETATAKDGTLTTTAAGALVLCCVAAYADGTFTWDAPSEEIYQGLQGSALAYGPIAIAARVVESVGSVSMGGDWASNPSRSKLTMIALKPA